MAFELPEDIYSPQLLELVVYELEHYSEWYREQKVKRKVGAATVEEPNHSPETSLVLEAWKQARPAAEASVEELITTLKALKLPVVHITLAALPNRAQRTALVRWFQDLGSPRPLVMFSADRSIGGGLLVRTPNHIYDLSLRQRLDEARAKLGQVVAHV